jgi:hypothetical protein
LVATQFSEEEIVDYSALIATFIRSQREAYVERATLLPPSQVEKFSPFFNPGLLRNTFFFHKKDGPIEDPVFLKELNDRGLAFSLDRLRAITFMDVIVSYEELKPQVQFHELVHVVQYQKLGLKQFAHKYLRGFLVTGSYESIPLEKNAYVLDQAYSQNPDKPFSVEQEVQTWINGNKF